MKKTWVATLSMSAVSLGFTLLLVGIVWFSSAAYASTYDMTCELGTFRCPFGFVFFGLLMLLTLGLVYPYVVLVAQRRIIGYPGIVVSAGQLALYVGLTILPVVAFTLACWWGETWELVALCTLAVLPTTVVTLVQGLWWRRHNLTQDFVLSRRAKMSIVGAIALASGVAAVAAFTALSWETIAESPWRLNPPMDQFLIATVVTTTLGVLVAVVVLTFIGTSAMGTLIRRSLLIPVTILSGITIAVFLYFGFIVMAFSNSVNEITVVGDKTYFNVQLFLSNECYVSRGYLLMDRGCSMDPWRDDSAPKQKPQSVLPPESEPELDPTNDTFPKVGEQWLGNVSESQVVARIGACSLRQVAFSLGQRGVFVAAAHEEGAQSYEIVAVDASFIAFEESEGVLIAAFSPDPRINIMMSDDGGVHWSRLDLPDQTTVEDMRFFHSFTGDSNGFTLVTGYPSWVDADEEQTWQSADGHTWVEVK